MYIKSLQKPNSNHTTDYREQQKAVIMIKPDEVFQVKKINNSNSCVPNTTNTSNIKSVQNNKNYFLNKNLIRKNYNNNILGSCSGNTGDVNLNQKQQQKDNEVGNTLNNLGFNKTVKS